MVVKEEIKKHTSYNSGYKVTLPSVASPKLPSRCSSNFFYTGNVRQKARLG